MDKAKYIIIVERGYELPIVFHPIISHVDIGQGRKVVSAGFCEVWGREPSDTSLDTLTVAAYGKSVSLKDEKGKDVVSRKKEDADIIKKMLYNDN